MRNVGEYLEKNSFYFPNPNPRESKDFLHVSLKEQIWLNVKSVRNVSQWSDIGEEVSDS